MAEVIKAYMKGDYWPTQPLNLRESQTVYIQVVSDEAAETEGAEIVRLMVLQD
jgi:predicted DNA-binding antitoxin AbrB/MazE fold protein